jgi:hypothetical protein
MEAEAEAEAEAARQLKAITESIVGQDLITGRKLEGWERVPVPVCGLQDEFGPVAARPV